MRSPSQHAKLLHELADAIKGPMSAERGAVMVGLFRGERLALPVDAYDDLRRKGPPDSMGYGETFCIRTQEVKVLGVTCQAFSFEGVLLKVIPI